MAVAALVPLVSLLLRLIPWLGAWLVLDKVEAVVYGPVDSPGTDRAGSSWGGSAVMLSIVGGLGVVGFLYFSRGK